MKKFLLHSFIAGAALVAMAGCAQIKKPPAQAKAAPVGVRFDQSRLGQAVSWRTVHAADHVRFSRLGLDGLARCVEIRNENTHRGGKE